MGGFEEISSGSCIRMHASYPITPPSDNEFCQLCSNKMILINTWRSIRHAHTNPPHLSIVWANITGDFRRFIIAKVLHETEVLCQNTSAPNSECWTMVFGQRQICLRNRWNNLYIHRFWNNPCSEWAQSIFPELNQAIEGSNNTRQEMKAGCPLRLGPRTLPATGSAHTCKLQLA